jgi:hypothetical protein
MAICGGCGHESSRVRITMTTAGGKRLLAEGERTEECPNCRPEHFQDPFLGIDNKIWLEHEAKPNLYKLMPDGSFTAKDELLADIDAVMNVDPDAERMQAAIEHKRANRRTTPMTQTEIERMERAWRPVVQEMIQNHDQAIEADKLATEEIVLKHVRRNYEERGERKIILV